jgi:hypothetical protein
MHVLRWLWVVGVGLAPIGSLSAADYEVAQQHPQAGDDGPGTTDRPWKTLGKAAETAGPGDVVVIRGGVYRERVTVKASGTAQAPIRFQAAPGEHVVLTGADRLTGWRRVDDARPVYSVAWPHRFITWNPGMSHPNDEHHRVIGRCEQVMVNGYLLRQVLDVGHLVPGTFFVDVTNQTLQVWDTSSRDLNKVQVEASVRQERPWHCSRNVIREVRCRVLCSEWSVLEDCGNLPAWMLRLSLVKPVTHGVHRIMVGWSPRGVPEGVASWRRFRSRRSTAGHRCGRQNRGWSRHKRATPPGCRLA